jgi:hypothetical protein
MRIALASLALLCASAASACPYHEQTSASAAASDQTAQAQPDTAHN